MTVSSLQLAELVASVAGVLGVTFAVYLQLLSESRTPPAWVFMFFMFGAAMLLMHPKLWAEAPVAQYRAGLQLSGAVLAVIGELGLAGYVILRYSVETPVEVLRRFLTTDVEEPA